jgi:hypothetical protein
MKFLSKISMAVLATSLLAGISTSAVADGRHGSADVAETGFGASLASTTGYTGAGSIHYVTSTNGSSLHASVHLPVGDANIADSNAAVTLAAGNEIVLSVYNGATLVASYNLQLSDVDFTYSSAAVVSGETAEFVFSASQSTTVPYAVTAGSSTATSVPVLASGETVSLSVNGATLLSGTLAAQVAY